MHLRITLAIALSLFASACIQRPVAPAPAPVEVATPAPAAAANPFLTRSTLQYQAPPFDRIKDSHFQPAIEEGMRQHIAEIDAIANSAEPATFENTVVAMERTGVLLTRVGKVFLCLAASNLNDEIQRVQGEMAPRLAAHQDAIYMNPKLFAKVRSLYDRRDTLGLDVESKFLLERYHRNFVRAGALLNEADQAQLRAINQEESTLTTKFRDKVLADTNESAVVVDNRADLAGLSDADIDAAAQLAKDRGLAGKYVLRLTNTTRQPIAASMENRALRARIYAASSSRGNHGGENDTKAIAQRLAQLRAQRAKLLGFSTYAAYSLDDQMAKTPENAFKLMIDLVPAATAKARGEAADMQKMVDAEKSGFTVAPHDWEHYAEKVRKAQYDLDETQIRPYLELDRVLNDGVFYAANQLFGITFKPRTDIPVYHPDVRVWEVFDADGSSMAIYYGDFFARPSKSGGAWMDSFVDQSNLLGTKPVVLNVMNVTKPAAGQPALLSWDENSTLFHEFGHTLHGLLSNVKYPTFTGTNVPRDFVEFPSQINEHWALEPRVFANYAKHHQTGAPMPAELVAKIKKSRTFNQGYDTTEYLAAALLDMAWHTLPADAPQQDVATFEPAALKKFNVDLSQVPPRYRTTYFSHIWGGGYSAGYYAYLWSEVLDHDAYYWFRENGGMTRANGQRFRDMLLSRGGTQDAATLYRAFRGRDPLVEPLLIERGLKPAPPEGE